MNIAFGHGVNAAGKGIGGPRRFRGIRTARGKWHAGSAGRVALLAILAALLCCGSAAGLSRVVLGEYGEAGQGAGQFGAGATDVAVNVTGAGGVEPGTIYLVDSANRRVERWAPTATGATFDSTWGMNVVSDGAPEGFEVCRPNPPFNEICQAGTASAAAGGLGNLPQGIAVDQATGKVYVADQANRRIAVYSAVGSFQGAFGWGVKEGDVAPVQLGFCTNVTGCQAGQAGEGGGQLGTGVRGVAVDPRNGHVYLANMANGRVDEFAPMLNGSNEAVDISFVRAFGWDVVVGGGTEFEVCLPLDTCKKGTAGGGAGQFNEASANGGVTSVAVGNDGSIFAVDVPFLGACNATNRQCRVQKFDSDSLAVSNFAQSQFSTTNPPRRVEVEEESGRILVVRKEAASGYRVLEFDENGIDPPEASPPGEVIAGSGGNAGFVVAAAGEQGRMEVLQPQASRVLVLGLVPPPGAEMAEVTDISATEARFVGEVDVPAPGGENFETRYQFEYSSNGTKWSIVPEGEPNVGNVAGSHPVEAAVTELNPNTEYLVRLKACTSSCVLSESTLEFSTESDAPAVRLTFADEVSPDAARLGAHIVPNGQPTTYYFEWGRTTSYGERAPAFKRSIGSGSEMVVANESISDLEPDTGYHFRVVAENPTGKTVSQDMIFWTLNGCGLTKNRCFELVSPADKGPVGEVGETILGGSQPRFRPATVGDQVAYLLGWGLPGATAGGEVIYQATRSEAGWESQQLSPPTLIPAYWTGNGSESGGYQLISDDLDCAVLTSIEPLTADAPQETTDAGKPNLFIRHGDGSYTAITDEVPTNLAAIDNPSTYRTVGVSADCSRVYFTSLFKYAGAGGTGSQVLYKWHDGQIEAVSLVPGETESVYVDGQIGAGPANYRSAVSSDGERVVFTATSQTGEDVGKRAVFLRDGSDPAINVSTKADGGTASNQGASFQAATPGGEFVFFLANYGLTVDSSAGATSCSMSDGSTSSGTGEGCDLYRYEVSSSELINLSANSDPGNPKGAGVAGVLGVSDNGSRVYFASRAQLTDGEGNSYSKNLSGNRSYNVYLWDAGALAFVGTVAERDVSSVSPTGANVALWQSTQESATASRVTPDGTKLLFQSTEVLTAYDSGGAVEAYLYDAEAEQLVCVSCRRDGEPSWGGAGAAPPLATTAQHSFPDSLHPPVNMSDNGSRVYFSKFDALAHGAVEGRANLYLWEEGQTSLLASGWPGVPQDEGAKGQLAFGGASANGDNIYLSTPASLLAADRDERQDLYVARIGGGFPDPAPPPALCDPLLESQCQDGKSALPPSVGPPASATVAGSGNQAPPASSPRKGKTKKKKAKKRGQKGSKKRKSGKKRQGKRNRATTTTRRAAR